MKLKTLILALVMATTPAAFAEESSNTGATVMKWGGGAALVIGGVGYLAQKSELDDCKDVNANSTLLRCANESELEDRAALLGGVAIVGGVVMLAGFALDANAVPFNIYANPDGSVALERNGLSLNASNRNLSLQKRWTF